jgi:DNA (cytosine-5)-methyltransferase 1
MAEFRVIELFAGVGGFRVGLERANKTFFNTIWSNQWEPSTRIQHASRTYVRVFGEDNHSNEDIAQVKTSNIPDHDMLVGGFPCQDYSVARTLSQSEGLVGKKGVLWWEIHRIVKEKGDNAPSILFLENVDRLLQSPASQRGRDFAIILQSLSDLGYHVEWRVINASEYGMPQRRRRTYILAYKKGTPIANTITSPEKWMFEDGVFAKAFPVKPLEGKTLTCVKIKEKASNDLAWVSDNFNKDGKDRMFLNAGLMIDGKYYTYKTIPEYSGPFTTLGDVVLGIDEPQLRETITENFYIKEEDIAKWQYQKGSKKEPRTNKQTGITYMYSEGGMAFPDSLDMPSRTIITNEGTKSANRFTHVIQDPVNGRLRRLVPIELERLDMFPDNHTEGETPEKRAFFMGNALVCGIVEKVGCELYERLK